MNKNLAEQKMNRLGEQQIPFLFIIDFEMNNNIVIPLSDLPQHNIRYSINENNAYSVPLGKELIFNTYPISFKEYSKIFASVQSEIRKGNSYLLNLTAQTPIYTNLSLSEIYKYSKAKYKLYFDDKFVVFSPETFVTIKHGKIYSYPMKGTIDADLPNAEQIILSDLKEAAEHATIVDLIRNDLGIIAKNIKVEKYRFISKLTTNKGNLLQVSSEISGCLSSDYSQSIGSLLFKLLPAGSISGAPKEKTVEIITNNENYSRNYYTGIFGIFDGKNLDSAVMIRFIEKNGSQMLFKSGGGITINSNVHNEYQELIQKVYLSV